MNVQELIAHIRATAVQYGLDANALRDKGRPGDVELARYYDGKADGYFVAACWIEDHLITD